MPRFRSHDGTEFSTRPPPGGTPFSTRPPPGGTPFSTRPPPGGTPSSTRPPPGGTPLAYHEKGAGPPLVCVPGGPARALMRWNQDGEDTAENRHAASPFFFGPWTPAAQEFTDTLHARHFPEATAGFRVDGAFGDPADTHKALADLAAPVPLLGGDLDPAPTPRLLTDYAALFANATLIIQPESGHSPWIDDPGEFVTTVNRFLSGRVASRQ